MAPCHGTSCSYGFETVTNSEAGDISGSYRDFVETMSFFIFAVGVGLNTGVVTILISAYPNLDSFDGFLMNLSVGELLSSFGLAFVFFVEFTTTLAPIGDSGCRFLTWLDVTSVTITIAALVAVLYDLHNKIYYANSIMSQKKFIMYIILTWLIASIPGLPYAATAKMGDNKYCWIMHWSHNAEILFICGMLLFQVLIPMAILVFLFVRIFIALRMPREGDTILTEETNPGSETTFQRAVRRRKVMLVLLISVFFFLVLILVTLTQLSLTLNIDQIENSPTKYRRIREALSLFECLKCVIVPLIYIVYYDKLRQQFKRLCCCRRDQDVYNPLNLRYNVYQQTVHETSSGAIMTDNRDSGDMSFVNDEVFETERDDVAILDNAA